MSRLGDYEKIERRDVLVLFVGSVCPGYLRVPNIVNEKKNRFVT